MRLSECSHGEMTVSRQWPRETEKCRSAIWRILNLPEWEKWRGAARGGTSVERLDKTKRNTLDEPRTFYAPTICDPYAFDMPLVFRCRWRLKFLKPVPWGIFTVEDIQLGDNLGLPFFCVHIAQGLPGAVPQKKWWYSE